MRFSDWPPRRIGAMWMIGVAVQLLALWIVPPLLGWRHVAPVGIEWKGATPLPAPSGAETQPGTGMTITRTPLANGDTLVRISRDSSWFELRTMGDTAWAIRASPDVERNMAGAGQAFAYGIGKIVEGLTMLLALIFVIPTLLSVVTLAWWIQRRRRAPA
jgi:hypothetical protein